MRKNYVKSILLIIVCMIVISACSTDNKSFDSKNPIVITLWHYYMGDNLITLENSIREFNQTIGIDKGIIIEAVGMGSISELEQNVTDSAKGAINSEPMPDIFSCYPDKALELDTYGKLSDLNDSFSQEEKEEYVANFLEDGYFSDGRLLLLPIAKSTEILYINNTAWERFCNEYGATDYDLSTWEGLYETARDYYNWVDANTPDIKWDGKGMVGIDSLANYIISANRQLGIEIMHIDADNIGSVVLDKKVLKRIFQVYYKAYSMGYFDALGKFRSDDVKSNDLIAYLGSSSGASYFPDWVVIDDEKEDIELLVMGYPVFQGGDRYVIQQGAGMCIAKNGSSQERAAALFLKWFTEKQNNIKFALSSNYIPVKTESYYSDEFRKELETMSQGDKKQRNTSATYQVVLEQIKNKETYAVRPFEGNYEVRKLLQESMMKIAEEGRGIANELKAQNMTEEDLIHAIDSDKAFEKWLEALEETLTSLHIPFDISI